MVNRHTAKKFRKFHRYLGLFIGIQFIMWTLSGLYFSWTDIDEIHGDQFLNEKKTEVQFENLKSPSALNFKGGINSLQLKSIAGKPYYFINNSKLINAESGESKIEINRDEALQVASKNMRSDLKVLNIERITEVGNHSEYRGGSLPAYVVTYNTKENVKAYIAAKSGDFKMVRHRDWRWFDFLWMTHTMDYEGRDNINNYLLRVFSIMGLVTVLSGFTLWFISSPTIRRVINSKK